MIRLFLQNYTTNEAEQLASALDDAAAAVMLNNHCNANCNTCTTKNICTDLYSASEFLRTWAMEQRLNNRNKIKKILENT